MAIGSRTTSDSARSRVPVASPTSNAVASSYRSLLRCSTTAFAAGHPPTYKKASAAKLLHDPHEHCDHSPLKTDATFDNALMCILSVECPTLGGGVVVALIVMPSEPLSASPLTGTPNAAAPSRPPSQARRPLTRGWAVTSRRTTGVALITARRPRTATAVLPFALLPPRPTQPR